MLPVHTECHDNDVGFKSFLNLNYLNLTNSDSDPEDSFDRAVISLILICSVELTLRKDAF